MRAVALVNANARGASARVVRKIEQALPGRAFVTRTLDEARTIVRAQIRRGVDLVVFGGGDGTVVMGLALVAEACRGAGRPEPAIGVAALGSGNALARTLGANTRDPVDDLVRLARGDGHWRALPMIAVMGMRAPFAGLGIDAQLLEDHEAVGRVVDRVPFARRLIGAAPRYAMSVALRSLPRLARGRAPRAVVRNAGAPAIAMARGGIALGEIPTGSPLWSGPYTLIAGATIPHFGFGLRMFPFAQTRADRFHLRCGDTGLFEILRSTPAAFRGEFFGDSVKDFLCDRVEIEILDEESSVPADGAPVEAGGELIGRQPRVELALAPPITIASLSPDQR